MENSGYLHDEPLRAGGWADVNISFPEHNSATVKNIFTCRTVRSVLYKNANTLIQGSKFTLVRPYL